jgi:hypothetical protein
LKDRDGNIVKKVSGVESGGEGSMGLREGVLIRTYCTRHWERLPRRLDSVKIKIYRDGDVCKIEPVF